MQTMIKFSVVAVVLFFAGIFAATGKSVLEKKSGIADFMVASNRQPVQLLCVDDNGKRCTYGNSCQTGPHTCDENPCPACAGE